MHPLQDLNILVTRPTGLQQALMRLLQDAGANAYHLPAIDIVAPSDDDSRNYARDHLDEFDIAIFISPTSVAQTLQFMPIDDQHCRLAAIGSRSQLALEQAGLDVSIRPQGHDSESLLRQDEFQTEHVAGKNIVIFRGEDGRDVLAEELRSRGASVYYAAMYTRVRPQDTIDAARLDSLHAITISSNEGLQNLYDMVRDDGLDTVRLCTTCLFVPGERARKLATQLGFERVFLAENATDQAMFDALEQHADKCV